MASHFDEARRIEQLIVGEIREMPMIVALLNLKTSVRHMDHESTIQKVNPLKEGNAISYRAPFKVGIGRGRFSHLILKIQIVRSVVLNMHTEA
jgi:hypothetical protein